MLGFNRWHLFKMLAAMLCIAGFVWLALAYFIPAPPSTITFAAGTKGSAAEQFAQRYQEIFARANVTLDIRITEGSRDSLGLVEDRSSGVNAAFLFGGITNGKQSPGLMSLGRVSLAPLWLFYRGPGTLDRLTQLKGKRIAVGLGFRAILAAHGVNPDNATLLQLVGPPALKAMKDGEVDVIFSPGELNSPVVHSLLRDPTIQLMSFTQAEAMTRLFPYLTQLVLPQGVVDLEKNIPASDVSLIAVSNPVVVRKDLHPELVYLLAQALSEVHGGVGIFQRAGDFPTQTDPEFPIAESARDFYRNGSSFLSRYLPFWITNYVQRTIAVLVTVIAIVVPLFSYAPKLYRGLVEYRLGSMYRRLREIEASLQKDVTISELSALEAELASVNRAIHSLGVPKQHSDLFFSIKSHLDLVRINLGLRRAELQSQMTKAA